MKLDRKDLQKKTVKGKKEVQERGAIGAELAILAR